MYNSFEQEIKELLEEIAKNPKSKAFIKLGNIYLKLEMMDETIEVIKEGLRYAPDNLSAMLVLAKAYKEKRNFNEASKLFEKIISKDPQNLLAVLSLAEIKKSQGNLEESFKFYDNVLFLDPSNEDAKREVKLLRERLNEQEKERKRNEDIKKKKEEEQKQKKPKEEKEERRDLDDFIIQHSSNLITFGEEEKEKEIPDSGIKIKEQKKQQPKEVKSQNIKEEKKEEVKPEMIDESKYINPSIDFNIARPKKDSENEKPIVPFDLPGSQKVLFYSKEMALIYIQQKKYEKAIEIYQMLLRHNPESEEYAERIRFLNEEIAKQEFFVETVKEDEEKKNKSRTDFIERLNKSLSPEDMTAQEFKKANKKYNQDKQDEKPLTQSAKSEINEEIEVENKESLFGSQENRKLEDKALNIAEENKERPIKVEKEKIEEKEIEEDETKEQRKETKIDKTNIAKASFNDWVKIINERKEKNKGRR